MPRFRRPPSPLAALLALLLCLPLLSGCWASNGLHSLWHSVPTWVSTPVEHTLQRTNQWVKHKVWAKVGWLFEAHPEPPQRQANDPQLPPEVSPGVEELMKKPAPPKPKKPAKRSRKAEANTRRVRSKVVAGASTTPLATLHLPAWHQAWVQQAHAMGFAMKGYEPNQPATWQQWLTWCRLAAQLPPVLPKVEGPKLLVKTNQAHVKVKAQAKVTKGPALSFVGNVKALQQAHRLPSSTAITLGTLWQQPLTRQQVLSLHPWLSGAHRELNTSRWQQAMAQEPWDDFSGWEAPTLEAQAPMSPEYWAAVPKAQREAWAMAQQHGVVEALWGLGPMGQQRAQAFNPKAPLTQQEALHYALAYVCRCLETTE